MGFGAGEAVAVGRRLRSLIATLMMTAIVTGVVTIHDRAWAQSVAQSSFDIPAGPLNRALMAYGRQAGLQVTYLASVAAGKTSPGLSGPATREQAIARILQGTGLSYRFTNATTVAISPQATASGAAAGDGSLLLDTIEVQGRNESAWGPVDGIVAHRSASSTKTDTSLLETPQSVSVVTAAQVAQQGTQTIGEALRYTPGTYSDIYGTNTTRDLVRIRGFAPKFYQDGLVLPYGIGSQGTQSEPFGLERIEVLRGPSSVLYGQNPPGGIINMVSKRPLDEPRREVFVQAGNFSRLQAGFDVSGPVTTDKSLLYRVVGLGRSSGTQVDFSDNDRSYFAPSFTWRPSNATSLTVLASFQRDRAGIIDQYFPAAGTRYANPNGRIRTSTNIGEPGLDKFDRKITTIGYEFSHAFTDHLSFRQNAGYNHAEVYNASTFTTGILADNRTITRRFSTIDRTLRYFSIDNQLLAKVVTGPLRHEILVGVDHRNSSELALNGGVTVAPNLNVFAPVYGRPFSAFAYSQNYRDSVRQTGVYAQDQIRFDKWLLTLSGRHDWSKTGRNNYFPTRSKTEADDRAFTGRVGLSYLFDNGLAPYVSYSTSFEPVTGSTSPARGSEAFKPTEGEQFEAGLKYQPTWFDGLFTAAVFDLRQTNVSTTDTLDTRYNVQTGEVRARGFELEARANITPSLSVIGSYSYTDTEITKSNVAAQLGRVLPSTPKDQASFWAQYAFKEGPFNGLSVGGGVRYIGATYGDAANLWRVPGYTLVDASLTLDLGKIWQPAKGATFQVNANNLFDKEVVNICFNAYSCMIGQRRTVLATLRYQW